MSTGRKTIFVTAFLAVLWIATVGVGLRALGKYENTPGKVGVTPESWPAESTIARAENVPTLLLFAHPRCPCTRASIAELAQIMAQLEGKVSAQVVFLKPEDTGADWDNTDLEQSAAAIPGVSVFIDRSGAEARRFGAETSGQTLLFAADGRRLFEGGITGSRGHAGDNAGETAVVSLVKTSRAAGSRTHVFGCSLVNAPPRPDNASCSKPANN